MLRPRQVEREGALHVATVQSGNAHRQQPDRRRNDIDGQYATAQSIDALDSLADTPDLMDRGKVDDVLGIPVNSRTAEAQRRIRTLRPHWEKVAIMSAQRITRLARRVDHD